MKDFYTIVDDDGFPIKMHLENKMLHIKKVSLNKCEEYQSQITAENSLRYLENQLRDSDVMILSGRPPFKASRVVTVRHLIDI